MSRSFNTTGPCIPGLHYMLPPLERIPAAIPLAEGGKYFVLHAPRQSGKTTSLRALRDELNQRGNCYAVYCSLLHEQMLCYANRCFVATTGSKV